MSAISPALILPTPTLSPTSIIHSQHHRSAVIPFFPPPSFASLALQEPAAFPKSTGKKTQLMGKIKGVYLAAFPCFFCSLCDTSSLHHRAKASPCPHSGNVSPAQSSSSLPGEQQVLKSEIQRITESLWLEKTSFHQHDERSARDHQVQLSTQYHDAC